MTDQPQPEAQNAEPTEDKRSSCDNKTKSIIKDNQHNSQTQSSKSIIKNNQHNSKT